jgi:hypothetical protein
LRVSIGITRGWLDNSDLFRREDTLIKRILTVALAKKMAFLDGHTYKEMKQVATKDWSKFVQFRPESVFVIAQNHNPRFGMLRKEILIALYCQDPHSRDCLWPAFFAKGTIFSQSDFTVCVEGLKTAFFLLVALQPDFTIRMCIGQSFEQCRRTLRMKVQSTDEGCNRIKS